MLGDNIRKARKSKKLSINKLSGLTGISLGYLSDLENNKAKNPTMDKLKAIADILDVPVSNFLSTEEKLEIASSSMNKIAEIAKKGLNYKSYPSDQDLIKESDSEYRVNSIFSKFENEVFTKEEEVEIINYIKYILSKRK